MTSTESSEMAHTPGPWKITKCRAGKNGTALSIWRNNGDEKNTGFKTIAMNVHHEPDARLIAACPTMYEYIIKKANEGDAEAARIVAKAAQP